MDYTKSLSSLGFLAVSRANIKESFYKDVHEGLAVVDAGLNNYTISPLDFLPLESLGSPASFRSELENINFIQECNLQVEHAKEGTRDFTTGNCTPNDLVELMVMLNTFHVYEFASGLDDKKLSSRGSLPDAPEKVAGVRVNGGELIARAAFLETTNVTGNTQAFFDFVKSFNRIQSLELSLMEWESILVNLDFFDNQNLLDNITQSLATAHSLGIIDSFAEIGVEREKIRPMNKDELIQHLSFAAFTEYAGLTKDAVDFNVLRNVYDSIAEALKDDNSGVFDYEMDGISEEEDIDDETDNDADDDFSEDD